MEKEKNKTIPEFFAAANSYNGFISYFDDIFKSENFDRIYVIKGGSGTGKSSLMKRISERFNKDDYSVERILCSSDPSSLDGVIISSKNGKIAMLDGTSPHERDAKIPGAKDEIINLADALDKRWIAGKSDEIISLINQKAKSYRTAYNYLSIAGKADGFIKSIYAFGFDKYRAKNKAESFLQDIPSGETGEKETRLISSFSKYGEVRLNTLSKLNSRIISLSGNEWCTGIFLGTIEEILDYRATHHVSFPCTLNPTLKDALYLPQSNLVITSQSDGEIDSEDLFSLSVVDIDQIKKAKKIREDALEEAKRWFGVASDMHFRLEKIYGEAMNFDVNEGILEQKATEISIILEKER